jgi:hypothetical protein
VERAVEERTAKLAGAGVMGETRLVIAMVKMAKMVHLVEGELLTSIFGRRSVNWPAIGAATVRTVPMVRQRAVFLSQFKIQTKTCFCH